MDYTVIIPARRQSTRLPDKVLLSIAGKPMLAHVIERAKESEAARIIVSSADATVLSVADALGVEVCETRADHLTGTDRIVETVEKLQIHDKNILVGLQADEPMLPASLLDQVASAVAKKNDAAVATLSMPITSLEDYSNPNVVKVVRDKHGYANYFSRASLPYCKKPPEMDLSLVHRHIGLYAYRARFLKDFCTWPVAPTEQLEQLEQLRTLWQGARIYVEEALAPPGYGVDTLEDLEKVRALFGG